MKNIASAFPSSDARAKLRYATVSLAASGGRDGAHLDRRREERPGDKAQLDEDDVDEEHAERVALRAHAADEVHHERVDRRREDVHGQPRQELRGLEDPCPGLRLRTLYSCYI